MCNRGFGHLFRRCGARYPNPLDKQDSQDLISCRSKDFTGIFQRLEAYLAKHSPMNSNFEGLISIHRHWPMVLCMKGLVEQQVCCQSYQNVEGKVATLKVPNVLEFGRVSDLRPCLKQGPHSSFSAIWRFPSLIIMKYLHIPIFHKEQFTIRNIVREIIQFPFSICQPNNLRWVF